MRRLGMVCVPLLLAGCHIEQQGREFHVSPPPAFIHQTWGISQQETSPGGTRVCTVSAGEIDVTQRGARRGSTARVSMDRGLAPGESYKILFGDTIYETLTGRFSAADSAAIIERLKRAKMVYTELTVNFIGFAGGQWRHVQNEIPLAGFPARYRACERFMTKK
ncbi:MAG: hypothetical protein KGI29_02110 [Pseudomonadota bacterium]|nr:hypothetical protein [Pseudomonadota bacterium]MDE3037709.1 hypothetical protein [Pseudomonadota bacterium]